MSLVLKLFVTVLTESLNSPGSRQCQHPLFEILSVVARVATGDGNEGWLGAGSFVGSSRILTTDRKRGRIDVYLLGLDSKDPTSPAGQKPADMEFFAFDRFAQGKEIRPRYSSGVLG